MRARREMGIEVNIILSFFVPQFEELHQMSLKTQVVVVKHRKTRIGIIHQ